MPTKKDGKRLARRSKRESAPKGAELEVDPVGDRTGQHSDSDGVRSRYGSVDRDAVQHEDAETEEGAE